MRSKRTWVSALGRPVPLAILFAVCMGLVTLGARACDNYINLANRAKATEGLINLDQIRTAQLAYHKEHGVFVSADVQPWPESDGRLAPFRVAEGSGWAAMGWPTTDFFRCQYAVALHGEDFRATARCDVDRDGEAAVFEATRDAPAKRVGSPRAY